MKKFFESKELAGIICGVIGGFLCVALFTMYVFSSNIFNYKIMLIDVNAKSEIQNTPQISDLKNINATKNPSPKSDFQKTDSLVKYAAKVKLLEELRKDKIILTPQEYTNNIANYYNTALTILTALLVIFSFVSYFHLRFVSSEQVKAVFKQSVKDSIEFKKLIDDVLRGKADDLYATRDKAEEFEERIAYLEEIPGRIEVLEEELIELKVNKEQYVEDDDERKR